MSTEDEAPLSDRPLASVTIRDKATQKLITYEIQRMELTDAMRWGIIARELVVLTELTADELKGLNLTLPEMFKLSMKVINAAVRDFQITNLEDPEDRGTPGRFAKLVFVEIARIMKTKYETVLTFRQEDFTAVVQAIWDQEGDGPFVQTALDTIRPVTSLLSQTLEVTTLQMKAVARSLGGLLSGGELTSFFRLPKPPVDGPNETSFDYPSEPLSDTDEQALSGPS